MGEEPAAGGHLGTGNIYGRKQPQWDWKAGWWLCQDAPDCGKEGVRAGVPCGHLVDFFFLKRWLKRIGLCAGGLVLLLLVFALEEHVRGRRALNKHLSRLRANGEVYSVAALEPKHPPADQNAFVDLTNLADRLKPIVKHLDDAPPQFRFAAPGKEIVAWRLNQWGKGGNLTNDWSRLGPELEEARPLLDLLHAAVQRPAYDSGFDYSRGNSDIQLIHVHEAQLVKLKCIAPLLQSATLYDLHQGNLTAAGGDLCAMVKFAADLKPEPLVTAQRYRGSFATKAFDTTWQALQAPGWNDAQLATLQAAWEGCDFIKDMESALEMERALDFDFYERIKISMAKLGSTMAEREAFYDKSRSLGSLPAHGFALRWLYVPLWRLAWADQQELFDLNEWKFVIEHERLANTNSLSALPRLSDTGDEIGPLIFWGDQMNWYDRLRLPFAQEGFTMSDRSISKVLCVQMQQEMAVTAIALHRYGLRTGMLPTDLSALVPKYLPALPRDYINGKTLLYRLQPDGNFVLYSATVGSKDNGGYITLLTDQRDSNQIWDGRDAVWPAPATDEEATAAMKSARN